MTNDLWLKVTLSVNKNNEWQETHLQYFKEIVCND